MNLVKGESRVFPKPGRSFDPALIPKAIRGAGFTAPEVRVVVVGTLAKREGQLELSIPGMGRPFVLAGGPQGGALAQRADLIGTRIRLTGELLHPSHAEQAPGLTVEAFEPET